jgi:hypothetical protein
LLFSTHYSRVAAELITINAFTSGQKLKASTSLLCIYFRKTIGYIMVDIVSYKLGSLTMYDTKK